MAANGWNSCSVGELMISKNDKSKQVKSTEYLAAGSYPVVDQSSDFICGYHDDPAKLIDTDLPLTVFGDHTRHTKYVDFPFVAGADGTQLLKPRRGIDDRFFYYLVTLAAERIGSFGYDRHFKHLKRHVCGYPRALSEQAKVAEILSTVDRAIEQTNALIAKQRRIRTGLVQDLLFRGIDEEGILRSEQTHRFRDSPLGRIPSDWKIKPLSEVTSKLITYGIVQPGPNILEGVPFVQTKDLGSELDVNRMDRTAPEIHAAYQRSSVRAGDVVIGIRASVGSTAIIPDELDYCNISRGVARLSPRRDCISGRFLLWMIKAEHVQKLILREVKGSTYPEITLPALRSIVIPVPQMKEQMRISGLMDAAENAVKQTTSASQKIRSLKDGLMQDLLTGKKRVTPLLEGMEVTS